MLPVFSLPPHSAFCPGLGCVNKYHWKSVGMEKACSDGIWSGLVPNGSGDLGQF